METFDKTALNQRVHEYILGGQFSKVAEAIRPYIRFRLYEQSFADQMLANRTVQEQDLQVEVEDDSYYVVSNIEQGTNKAVVANFIDRPIEDYISGKRYKIPLGMHKTRIRRKNVREMMAYDYDIMKDAADKDVYELGNLRDWKFLLMANKCIDLSGKEGTDIVDANAEGAVQVEKLHFNRLAATLNTGGRTGMPLEDRLEATKFLTHRQLIEDFALLDANVFGDPRVGDLFEQGTLAVIKSILGKSYVTSIKERFFTEHDHVTLMTVSTKHVANDTVTVAGTALTLEGTPADADATATAIAAGINGNSTLSGKGITATASGAVVRIVAKAKASELERIFIGSDPAVTTTGTIVASLDKGYDRYDVIWAAPEPQFIGEIIRLGNTDVETEMWKTNGEDMVNSLAREWFGMGIGNFNGLAKQRIQRARYLG